MEKLYKEINENEKEMEYINTKNEKFKFEKFNQKIDILSNEIKSIDNELTNNENRRKKLLDNLTHLKEKIKNNLKDNDSLLSQISSFIKEFEKEKNKIKGIQCRDENSKIN